MERKKWSMFNIRVLPKSVFIIILFLFIIQNCRKCRKHFDTTKQIHHCRACGEGFCDDCSEKTAPVPERGWGDGPVRVCDDCYREKMEKGRSLYVESLQDVEGREGTYVCMEEIVCVMERGCGDVSVSITK